MREVSFFHKGAVFIQMSDITKLSELDLAALLSSKVCHDVISPVGAINNGLEVLQEGGDDPQMQEFAMDLITKSARQASYKLQFARLAFGSAGGPGAHIDLGDAEEVTRHYLDGGKIELSWEAPAITRPKEEVKIILNLILLGTHAIPKGGVIKYQLEGDTGILQFIGEGAHIPENTQNLLDGVAENVDARGISLYYTGLLARSGNIGLAITPQEGEIRIDLSFPPLDTSGMIGL